MEWEAKEGDMGGNEREGGDERRGMQREERLLEREGIYLKGSEGCKGRERWGSRGNSREGRE